MPTVLRFAVIALIASSAWAQSSPLVRVLDEELQRNFDVLKQKGEPAPYFISYEVTETETSVLSASMGALVANNNSSRRYLDVTVRVGSRKLDNYHRMDERSRVAFGANHPS